MNKINRIRLFIAMTVLLGLSVAAPAQAQIAFRNAAQQTSDVGGAGGGAISFVAAGNQTVGTGASITPGIPGGTQAGDFAVLIVAGRPTNTAEPAAPVGWIFRTSSLRAVGANDLKIMTFYRVLAGGDTDPTVNLPATWQGNAAGMSGQIAVWRGVNATTPFDVADVIDNTGATNRWTPAGITTVTDGSWVVSAVASSDDNDLDLRRPNGFTGRMTRQNYDTTTGGDHAIAVADLTQATAGTPTMVEWRQRSNGGGGNDPWASITFALRPSPPAPNLQVTVPATTVAGDVMIASIAVRPCSSTNGGACTVNLVPVESGWTLVGATIDQTGGGGTGGFGNRMQVYWRVATAADAAGAGVLTYGWNFPGTPVHGGAVGGIASFSGVDTTSPIVVFGSQPTPNATSHTIASIDTVAVTNTMLVASFAANSSTTWSSLEGMSPAVDGSSLAVPNALGMAMSVFYQAQAAAGPTGPRTAQYTSTAASDTGTTHMLALRPAPTINHLSITHAGSGVACDSHTITITAHNAAHAPVSAGGLTVNLSTTLPRGTWTGIVSGGGTLSGVGVGTGVATYQFAPGSSTVQLSYRYANLAAPSEVLSFNVSGSGFSETSGTATAADDLPFTMAQAGFRFRNITDNNDTIPTQISGKPSNTGFNNKTIRLQAIRTDTSNLACVAAFPAAATRNVEMGAECNNPSTCAAQEVSITNNAITTAIPTSADNGGTGAAAYYATGGGVPLLFNANSEADIVITYPDAGQISLHARFDLEPAIAGFEMMGSSNLFVERPFGLAFRGANSGTAVQHATTSGAALLAAAGDNFTMTLVGYQWASGEDANNDGVPDAGVDLTNNGTVPNFAATATVASSANLAGVAGAVSRGAPGVCASASTITLTGGAATANDWCYSEVGNAFLTATVSNYITAGINITGNSGLDGTGAAGGYVGRFRPKQFAVSVTSLTNRTLAACGPPSSFTYMDEGLTLAFTLTAQNTLTATTQNYTGSYARHDPVSAANYGIAARNVTPFKDLTAGSRITSAYVTGAPTWSNGVLAVTGGNAAVATVARPTPDDPPDGPYTQVQFGIAPVEPDGVLMAAFNLDIDNSGGNDHTAVAPTTILRYGRLRLGAASGSQLQTLRVPVEAQYWNGTFWITNVDDGCTPLLTTNVGLGNFIGNLTVGETTVSAVTSPLSAGRGSITLSAPGAGNNGSVDLAVNLDVTSSTTATACPIAPPFTPSATGANKAYLRGKWCGATHTKDPSTRARFGINRGSDETIYLRENY